MTDAWRTFYRTSIVLATLAGAYLLYELSEILMLLFIAIVFASAVRPYIVWLRRRGVPVVLATVLLYVGVFLFFFGLLSLALRPLIGLTIELFTDGLLVSQVNRLLMRLAFLSERQFQVELPTYEIPTYMRALVAEAAQDTAQQAWPVAQGTLVVLGQAALALVMSLYWLTSHKEIQRLLLQIGPYRYRADIEAIWDDIEHTLGAYVRGQFIMMILVGITSYIGLVALRVEYALALAVIAGLTEAIPVVGPIVGAIPAVLVGFTISPMTGLLVALWYLVIQQLEGNVLLPKVMEENVGLNPLLVIIALTAGAMLNGVIGAILAIPLAGAAQVIIKRLLIQPAIERTEAEFKKAHAEQATPLPKDAPATDVAPVDAPDLLDGEPPPRPEG